MKRSSFIKYLFGTAVIVCAVSLLLSCTATEQNTFKPPVSFEVADQKAEEIVNKLSLDQKIKMLGGYSRFFIQSIPEYDIPHLFMADATQGMRIDTRLTDTTIVKQLEKTTAFPCPLLLASTWNPEIARVYARSVGEECRAGGVSILLGPGLNLYRQSQCGRNFEYFGEDPYLISRMIENYVVGVQSTGTASTLKHFICNNTDFYRRRSNSIVDERALHEIYLPGFKAGVDAGVMAVMTAYNQLNGEWCGQSNYVINNLLRDQLGFKWLVMTDWVSVYDGEKVIKSGQNLEMPERKALKNAEDLVESRKVSEEQINRMTKSILRTCFAMDFYNIPQQELEYLKTFDKHEQVALDVAREGIVLLKNEENTLPIAKTEDMNIVALGKYMNEIAHGGGSGYVEGYNNITLTEALKNEFGDFIEIVDISDEEKISSADIVLLSTGTSDSEGSDRPFDLPDDELQDIHRVLDLNEQSVVIVNSGSGINMGPWIDKTPAVVYAWYGGQIGNKALAEILSGAVNPSGKLPITIEKQFRDSPGYGYIPEGEELYSRWSENAFTYQIYDIKYDEGIFVGYRWYEHKNIEPLFAFGHGLSYSEFEYSNVSISSETFSKNDQIDITFTLKNTGEVEGSETAQLYIQDIESAHPRPVKELKGFEKVSLKAGEKKEVSIILDSTAFSYWNPDMKQWYAEPGEFTIYIGSSSEDIRLQGKLIIE